MKILSKLLAWIVIAAMLVASLPVVSVFAAYENTHVNTGDQAADIVAVAKTQVGYLEGSLEGTSLVRNNYTKYGVWYDNNVANIGGAYGEWCAMFVSWCANQAGIPSSIMYYHASCSIGVSEWKNRGVWHTKSSYVPKAGDIIYFYNSDLTSLAHVGLVTSCDGSTVYTVEGNTSTTGFSTSGGTCNAKSYSLSSSRIYGYASPAYEDNSGYPITFESNGGSAVETVRVKAGATLTEPTAPTRYGFDFAGWYCDPELNDPYDFSTPVNYDFTLYAKWTEAYWGALTNLMPNESQLQYDLFNDAGDRVWAYFNDDAYGSVTMYNGVTNDDNWSWPSAYMTYENSFDSAYDAYIYVKKDGNAMFNVAFTYLDQNGTAHTVKLSELAGQGENDFAAGYLEGFYNIGNYVAGQGHLTATGNVKFTQVKYYVIGAKDNYVTLYDLKLTPAFTPEDPYKSLYNENICYNGGSGQYTYDNGTLTLSTEDEDGYSVTFGDDVTFDPTAMPHLLLNVNSDVDYNITMELTNGDATNVVELRSEFFNVFGFDTVPAALPAGTFTKVLNMNGYYYYSGGVPATSTIKSVTISLEGPGTLTLSNLQVSETETFLAVNDGAYVTGYHDNIYALTSSVYTVGENTVSAVTADMTVADFVSGFDQTGVIVCDANGNALSDTDAVASGMTVKTDAEGAIVYTIVVTGDVNGDGTANSADARLIMTYALGSNDFSDWQVLAADYDGNGTVNTSDVRGILKALIA